jgi:hypothetical protein
VGNLDDWLDVGTLVTHAGKRLFARNIRGFLGMDTPINKSMMETLRKDPHGFFYRNNGVTIVCDRVVATGSEVSRQLLVANPQIINVNRPVAY